MDVGAFIILRCHGISTEINQQGMRAVTKMKARITQRFILDGIDADAESDCRFCLFWLKTPQGGMEDEICPTLVRKGMLTLENLFSVSALYHTFVFSIQITHFRIEFYYLAKLI
jgi:hypothetical protein